jgi:DNA modification methylase
LGPHRLLCGSALEPEAFAALLSGERAQLAITDPPYNVPIDGHASGLGRTKHRSFVMGAGEMSERTFTAFLTTALTRLAEHSVDGSIHFVFMDWRHMGELMEAGGAAYSELKNLCIWNKDNGGMGTFYRSKHELVFVYKAGTGPHINNFGLGERGRYRTNVWDYAGVNTFRPGRLEELQMHPTVKPVAMIADAIKDCSRRDGIVLDSFAGSGTTVIAAERTGRIARAIELDPQYVDITIKRWQDLTGDQAKLAVTGRSFQEVAEERANGAPAVRRRSQAQSGRKEVRHG